jgi:predicted acyl esterase
MANQEPIVNQVEEDYPIPRTEYKKLFLSGDGTLHHSYVEDYKTLSYQADSDASSDEITFVHKFAKPTQLAGYSKVRLYMSCKEHNDMDVFVMIKKIDRHGKPLVQLNCPMSAIPVDSLDDVPDLNPLKYLGASGILRASRRHYLHSPTSEEYNPYHTHDRDEFVKPGYIVRLDIGIWPMGMAFEEGEGIMLVIAGHRLIHPEFEILRDKDENYNVGNHIVHVGGEYGAHLLLPFI